MNSNIKSTEPSPKEGSDAFEKLAREIARRDALEHFEFLPHNSKLYRVEKSWKTSIIKDDPKVREVGSLLEFERAVCDSNINIIFIPSTALISDDGIIRVCQRNAVGKTILKEENDD